MRYHTTFKDIAVSILVVLACTGICLYGMLFFSATNPAQPFADFLLASLDRGSSLSLRATGVTRSFLQEIELQEVSLTLEEEQPLYVETLVMDGGVGKLLLSLLGQRESLAFTLTNPSIDISLAHIDLLQADPSTEPSPFLTKWLGRTSLELRTTSLDAQLSGPSYSASIFDAQAAITLGPNLFVTSLTADIASAEAHLERGNMHLQTILMDMDEERLINAEAQRGNFSYAGVDAHFSQLALATLFPSKTQAVGLLAFDFSVADVTVEHPGLQASIPKLSARLNIEELSFLSLEASYDTVHLYGNGLTVTSPTSTIKLQRQDASLLLGFATKKGAPILVQQEGFSALNAYTLTGTAQAEPTGELYARLSLDTIESEVATASIALKSTSLFAQALLGENGLGDITLSAESQATVTFEKADIRLASPLTASLSLREDMRSLSSSLTFSSLSSSLTQEPFITAFAYQQNREGGQLQAELSYQEQLLFNALYDLPRGERGTFSIRGRLQEFPLVVARPTLERYTPFFKPYYSEPTRLTGNFSFQSTEGTGTILGFDGTLASDLVLLDLSLGNRILDAGFTVLAEIAGDAVVVDSLSLSTSDLRLAYSGSTELSNWLPSGDLELFDTESGALLINATFSPLPPDSYRYAMNTPLVPSLDLEGVIARQGVRNLTSSASFSLFGEIYPLQFTFFTPTLELELTSEENLSLQAYLAPPYQGNLTINKLKMPKKGVLDNSLVTGDLFLEFNTLSDWTFDAQEFSIDSLLFNAMHYTLTGSLLATPTFVQTSNLTLSQGASSYTVAMEYSGEELIKTFRARGLAPFALSFILSEEQQPKISLSLLGDNSRVEALVKLEEVDLHRFYPPFAGVDLTLTAYGHTDFSKKVSMDGTLLVESPRFSFSSELLASDTHLQIARGTFTQEAFLLKDISLLIDAEKGSLSTLATFNHTRVIPYTEQVSHFNAEIFVPFTPTSSLFELGSSAQDLINDGLGARISIDDLMIFGERGVADGTYNVSYKKGTLSVTSPLLSFSYANSDGSIGATIDKEFGFGLSLSGKILPQNLALVVEDIYFPLPLLNRLYTKPIFGFIDGVAQGEIIIGRSLANPMVFGQLTLNSSSMNLFWLPEDILSVRGATVTLDGQRATSPTFPFFSTNRITGETVRGVAKVRADFDGLNFLSYEIDARPIDGQVQVFIPIQGIDAEVRTYAEGTFRIYGTPAETWLSGDVLLENTTMSLGIQGLPFWYKPTGTTSTDFTITTGKNVSFFYPNSINPFIKATLTENQTIDILFDHITEEISLDGTFAFRSGEIYYFQKNFFITEGSLVLHTDALSGFSTIQPRINLRAKLTDFDRTGNRVDIFLILRDSSLNNLNPQFESIPSKDINEILEIMGQSILPSGAYGQVNLFSVASLAAAATDVAGRLGYLTTANNTALTESIRISLGLDLFSLRSNIVQNILFDALPGSNLGTNFSPLARYLNNTTIFMGKYVGKNYFLQALIHLSATDASRIKRSFVAPDLAIDLELSLEWNNPLGTFSFFTQPNELSIFNIFDTIGFSVTKRIVLR